MDEIDLKNLFKTIIKRWWISLICIVLLGGMAYAYCNYYLVPIYMTSTTLYVGKNAEQNSLGQGDLYFGAALIPDYREIAKSRKVATEVIKELGISYMSPEYLSNMISIGQRNDSRVVQISVTDTNPKRAMDITNKVAEVFQKKVIDIMKVDNVQILDGAELPQYPISPNKRKYMMYGIILGFGLGIGIAFLIEYLDDNIKTPEDVQKYLDLPVIGTIPVFKVKGRRN